MSALKIASLLELFAMSVEMFLYFGNAIIWTRLKSPFSSFLSAVFFSGGMFTASNFMFGLTGLGLFERGGLWDKEAFVLQQVGAFAMAASMGFLTRRIER